MKIIFMGTTEFSVVILEHLIKTHEVVAVYTKAPKPKNRGNLVTKSPVHVFAEQLGLEVITPITLKNLEEQDRFRAFNADLGIVAAYGLILPPEILKGTQLGCWNVHTSLLPRWRGSAPIQRAILEGDLETGITIMEMDVGMDTGGILLQEICKIHDFTTCVELSCELAKIGAKLLIESIASNPKSQKQSDIGIVYAHKILKSECEIVFHNETMEQIDRKVRALNPNPGVWFDWKGMHIKLLSVTKTDIVTTNQMGLFLVNQNLYAVCLDGVIQILVLQKPGGRPLKAADFINGNKNLF